ncbi:TetR/AcrR family transcriptional regulator [Streptomyces sp. NPDC003247]|uniref:TetR/AcrR family transcriptional regulator n=1 Tax=Streptomyces sp. NPDC003247 TaxID=3364677 RepID=UPI0036B6A0CD
MTGTQPGRTALNGGRTSRTRPTSPSAAQQRADANRRRILDVAVVELLRDPDASMEQIARAAGVVRRTIYGHFSNRETLVTAIVEEAVEAVQAAHLAGIAGIDDPARAVASAMLSVWRVTDRYRLLLSLAQSAVTMQGIRERLALVHESGAQVLRRGLDEGRFRTPLSDRVLVYVLEQIIFSLMEAVNDGLLDSGEASRAAPITFLSAAGVPADEAAALVAELVEERASGG